MVNLTIPGLNLSSGSPSQPAAPDPRYEMGPKTQSQLVAEGLTYLLDPRQQDRRAVALQEGNEFPLSEEVAADIEYMNPFELERKYGREVSERVPAARVDAVDRYFNQDTSRGVGETVADSALGLGIGAINTVGSLASLGVGLLNDQAGVGLANMTTAASGGLRNLQSEGTQDANYWANISRELDRRDSAAEYERDIAAGDSKFEAGLARLGRGIVNEAGTILSDATLTSNLVAEALGSLGPSAKMASAAATAVRNRGGSKALQGVAVAGTVGVSEASGAYTTAVQAIMDMSEEQLTRNNEYYASLRENGMSHREAATRVANRTGVVASAMQLPAATALGFAVRGFEANPLGSAGLTGTLKSFGTQTVEEALQEGGSQFYANAARRVLGDNEVDLVDGVGQGMAAGAIGGAGMVAGTQGPGAVVRGAAQGVVTTAQGIAAAAEGTASVVAPVIQTGREAFAESKAGENAWKFAQRQAKNLNEWRNTGRKPTEEEASEIVSGTTQTLAQTATDLRDAGNLEVSQKILDTINLTMDEIENEPEFVTEYGEITEDDGNLTAVDDRFNKINNVFNAWFTDQITDPVEKDQAIIWVADNVRKFQEIAFSEMPPEISNLDPSDPRRQRYENGMGGMQALLQVDTVQKILQAQEKVQQSGETTSDPDLQDGQEVDRRVVLNMMRQATVAPNKVNPRNARIVLNQSRETLSPQETAALEAAAQFSEKNEKLKQIDEQLLQEQEQVSGEDGVAQRLRRVNNDVVLEGNRTKNLAGQQVVLPSMNQYLGDIQSSMKNGGGDIIRADGSTTNAQVASEGLRDFAQHQLNKLGALNESVKQGRKNVKFRKLTPDGWIETDHPRAGSVTAHDSPGSRRFAKQVWLETKTLVDNYNSALSTYGLQGEPLTVPPLDPDLNRGMAVEQLYSGETAPLDRPSEINRTDYVELTPEELAEQDAADAREAESVQRERLQGGKRRIRKGVVGPAGRKNDLVMSLEEDSILGYTQYIKELKQGIRDFKKKYNIRGKNTKILIRALSDQGLNPQGYIADQLRAADVTPRTVRGLFKRGGRNRLDNLEADVMEKTFPGIREATGTQNDDLYLDEDGLVQLIIQNADGDISWLQDGDDLALMEGALSDAEAALEELREEQPPEGPGADDKIVRQNQEGSEQTDDSVPGPEESATEVEGGGNPDSDGEGATPESREAESTQDVEATQDEPSEGGDPVSPQSLYERLSGKLLRSTNGDFNRLLRATEPRSQEDVLDTQESEDQNPVQALIDIIQEKKNLDTDKKKLFVDAIEKYVPRYRDAVNKRLQTLRMEGQGKEGKLLTEGIVEDGAQDFVRLKALTLMNSGENIYNEELLDRALLAALDYGMNAQTANWQSKEDIADSFGMDVNDVSTDMVDTLNAGVTEGDAKAALGRMIMDAWKLKPKNNVTATDAIGIAESMATEILIVMQDDRVFFEPSTVKVPNPDNPEGDPVDMNILRVQPKVRDYIGKVLKSGSTLIGDTIGLESKPGYTIGTPPETVPTHQKRNILTELTDRQKEAAKVQQDIPHFKNERFLPLVRAIGKDRLNKMLGSIDTNDRFFNLKHKESVDGKNNSNEWAWNAMEQLLDNIEAYEQENGSNAPVPIFFKAFYTKVNRLHQDGFSPQMSKLAREIFMSTESTLDLMDNEAHQQVFWVAVAQHLGVKVEKLQHDAAIPKVQKAITEQYRDAVDALKEHMLSGDQEITDELWERVTASEDDGQMDVVALHTLNEVARLELTAEEKLPGSLSEFTTSLYVEADGVTDGPHHAMAQFSVGEFTQNWVDNMRRSGMQINTQGAALNDYFDDGTNEEKLDLYETGTTRFSGQMDAHTKFVNRTKGNPKKDQALEAVKQLATIFGDVTIDPETRLMTFGRSVLKNPLTISIYGSSARGIADKIAQGMIEGFYERLSEAGQAKKDGEGIFGTVQGQFPNHDIMGLFADVMEGEFAIFDEKFYVRQESKTGTFTARDVNENLERFEFTPKQVANFKKNVLTFYGEPMVAAIDSLVAETKPVLDLVQKITQVQSLVMIDMFQQEVSKRKSKMEEDGLLEKGRALPMDERVKILQTFKDFGAILEGQNQNLNFGSSDAQKSNVRLSESLDERFRQEAKLPQPTEAGVRSSPFLTISNGDAALIDNVLLDPRMEGAQKLLAVFDGINLSLDKVTEFSEYINENVWNTWTDQNPITDFVQQADRFFRLNPMNRIEMDETREGIKRAMGLTSEDLEMGVNPNDLFPGMMEAIKEYALEIEARKNVVKNMGFSMDHMASAMAPYTHEGTLIDGTDQNLLDHMNVEYRKELERLRKKENSKYKPVVEKENKKFVAAVKDWGEEVAPGITKMNPDQFSSLFENLQKEKKITLEQANLFNKLKSAMWRDVDDIEFFFGSRDDLNSYKQENNLGTDDVQLGLYDPETRKVWVSNQTVESTLHEAVHSKTYDKIKGYYEGKRVTDQDEKAILKLKDLMDQFLELDYTPGEATARKAYEDAKAAVQQFLDPSISELPEAKAAALNEFMAWTLTNRRLIDTLKETPDTSMFMRLTKRAMAFMQRLIGYTGRDMHTAVVFNTAILLQTNTLGQSTQMYNPSIILNQSRGGAHPNAQSSQRLQNLMHVFDQKVGAYMRTRKVDDRIRYNDSVSRSMELANRMNAMGFPMSRQELDVFTKINAVIQANIELDPLALQKLEKIYNAAMERLAVNDFITPDETTNDPYLIQRGQDRFRVLTELDPQFADPEGRSALLSGFLALSQSNDDFRTILNKLEQDPTIQVANPFRDSLDEFLETLGVSMMDSVGRLAGEPLRGSEKVSQSLDRLALALGQIDDRSVTWIEQKSSRLLDKGDSKSSQILEAVADKTAEFATKHQARIDARGAPDSAVGRMVRGVEESLTAGAALATAPLSETRGAALADQGIRLFNREVFDNSVGRVVRELFNEIIGITDENAAILQHVNITRKGVTFVRQKMVEEIPKIIDEKFDNQLTEEKARAIHSGFARVDISALFEGPVTADSIFELFRDPAQIKSRIRQEENLLSKEISKMKNQKQVFPVYLNKAKQLANFMVNERAGTDLLRNPYAIFRLPGIANTYGYPNSVVPVLDRLVTLYALQTLEADNPSAFNQVKELIAEHPQAMEFMLRWLKQLKVDELNKTNRETGRYNHYKGYVPHKGREGFRLRVGRTDKKNELREETFTPIGKFEGGGRDYRRVPLSYYFSTTPANTTYSQGAMQTVRSSMAGVDPVNGRTLGGTVVTYISGQDAKYIRSRIDKLGYPSDADEFYMPVFDEDGELRGYEVSMSPEMLNRLDRDADIRTAMGAWAGRQAEELLAQQLNPVLVDNLYKVWVKDRDTRRNEYVNISDPDNKDPIHQHIWSIIPYETKIEIEEKFGRDAFWVRKDLVNHAVGYPDSSVSDIFTGKTRLPEGARDTIKDTLQGIMGPDAHKYLSATERTGQTFISMTKETIVVRSVVVPALNIASNYLVLTSLGVPQRDILRMSKIAVAEINQHLANEKQRIRLNAELAAARDNPNRTRNLKARLKALDEADNRMSINRLLQAGEFSSVSEGLTERDVAWSDGNWVQWVENKFDQLPKELQTTAKYAIISKDTALYQGLNRAVQYGDFVAKAVYWDYMVNTKGVDPDKATQLVTETFVNYNLLPGRTRDYLESVGLTWFLSYKIRSMKQALRMIRENPLRSMLLLEGGVVTPDLGIGSPMSDNLAAVVADDRIGYSLGYDMLDSSVTLNPWVQLLD